MKRFDIDGYGRDMVSDCEGDYVRFTDHEAAIKHAVAKEREACATMIENASNCDELITFEELADAVRQRGK